MASLHWSKKSPARHVGSGGWHDEYEFDVPYDGEPGPGFEKRLREIADAKLPSSSSWGKLRWRSSSGARLDPERRVVVFNEVISMCD
jgi:hypothetical protein